MDHRTTNIFENMASSSLARSRAIAVLFPLPQNMHGSFFRENVYVAILTADRKRFFAAAWTVMNNCRSQCGCQCAQLKVNAIRLVVERQVSLLNYRSTSCWFRRCWFHRCWFRRCFVSGACSAAASSSGAGADGATSTASRLLFSGWPSEVSSSLAVVVTQKLRILLVPATTLSM